MTRLAAILTCLSLAGCSAAPSPELQKTVEPGASVDLAPGESVALKASAMSVRFVAVTEDSRCPRDVTCVWAGQVKVQLEIKDGQAASPVEILEGASTDAGGNRVTLDRVEPRPVSTGRIAPGDYRVTLTFGK